MKMSKRSATTELNHTNWDEEEDPESAGVFKTASKEVMEKRVIRTAKRRITSPEGGEKKNVFSGFSGFGQSKSVTAPSAVADGTKAAFSFLSNSTVSQIKFSPVSKNESKEECKKDLTVEASSKDNIYLSKLKGLNEAVLDWIKQHVEANPCCILTPVFRDYENYLKEIQKEKKPSEEEKTPTSSGASGSEVKFSFGTSGNLKSGPPTSVSSILPSTSSASPKEKETTTPSAPLKTLEPTSEKKPPLFFGSSTNNTKPFSFGSGPPTTFSFGGLNSKPPNPSNSTEEVEEVPKNEFTAVKEDDAVFSQRVKVFIKKEESYVDRGVGNLFVKETPNGKFQALVRADTNLGNILFNIILTNDVPTKRLGKNNVMCICLPLPDHPPPPIPVLLRVKTSEQADHLLKKLDEYKK